MTSTIYEYIKEKQIQYLNAKLNLSKGKYSEKDLRQLKDDIFEAEENFKINGCQECMKMNADVINYTNNGMILFNDTYLYNPLKNLMVKITANERSDLAEGFIRRRY